MPDVPDHWISFSPEERLLAGRLASARMSDPKRRLSRDRPTARNLAAQVRGALGEIGAVQWLRSLGASVESGFECDDPGRTDIIAWGWPIEIMTAQVAHRQLTGFCVPPGKLRAARARGAWGYLFVGTGPEHPCARVCIQAAVELRHVDADPARPTRISAASPAVVNHVVRAEHLIQAGDFAGRLGAKLPPGRRGAAEDPTS